MTIRKGEPWGHPVDADSTDLPIATDDAALAHLVPVAPPGDSSGSASHLRVARGDLHRTLGLPDDPRSEPLAYPLDLGFVRCDGGDEHPFVAHVIARHRLWIGPFVVVMNAAWVDDLYLGPRAHPNDGLLDITSGRLPISQLREARRRARAGTHLPHPALSSVRRSEWSIDLDRATPVRIDGVVVGRARRLSVRIVPDAFVLVG